MQLLHSGLMLPILLAVALCLLLNVLTLHARQVAPLIEDDWARRPHRAAGKSFSLYRALSSAFCH